MNPGDNTGDTWNGIDISDLTRYFPRAQFMSFPPELRTRIHNSKTTTTKRSASQVDVSDMQSVVSDVSDLRSRLAEIHAVMQASRDNEPPSDVSTNESCSFGRPGQPPYKNTKGKWLSYGSSSSSTDSVYDSDYSDDDRFYTAGSQGDDTCGDPFAPSDHFFDTAEYHKNGNTHVLTSPQYCLSLSGQT